MPTDQIKPARRWRLRKLSRKTKIGIVITGSVIVLAMAAIYADVHHPQQAIYKEASSAPSMPVALVFGAGYNKDGLSPMLEDRVQTGVDLYKAGKVKMLLMTGDNGRVAYNEPDAMRKEAISWGVPPDAVKCDYAGFRTYDSVYRAREIFGVTQAIFVTQSYHLPRALYLARKMGIEAVGVSAEKQEYPGQELRDLREFASVETAWLDVNILHKHPKYLGNKEPLFAEAKRIPEQSAL